MNYKEITKLIKDNSVEFIDLKFTDLPGMLQHITLPVSVFSEELFTDGIGFDGSSIRGFQPINESDMLLKPHMKTVFMDPFTDDSTLSFICSAKDPITYELYSRDPRNVAEKAERYLTASGIADVSYFGPEAEFYIFDDIRYDQTYNHGFYYIDSKEGSWNTGREESPNLGYKPRYKEGYLPTPPVDSYQNLRSKMVKVLKNVGVEVEAHHHEVATGGQSEIDVKYSSLLDTADSMMKLKYVIKNVAHSYNKTVTFMPKPIFMDNGSGMHVNQSLWKNGKNIFYEYDRYADISKIAEYYIGGLIHHAASLLAFCAPTTNSYRRLVPGFEAPVNLAYSQRNRSACVRIPMYSRKEEAKRVELRFPDPSCNPYLAFSAMLMAGIDGIKNEIIPPDPIDKDLYELEPEEKAKIRSTPGSLEAVIDALENDHDYLMDGGVFSEDIIEIWIEYKREREIDVVKLRPHPAEFALYYDV